MRYEVHFWYLKNSNFDRVAAGWRRAVPGCTGKKNFGDHVGIKNLEKVTKFGYHTITGVDIPGPNVVKRRKSKGMTCPWTTWKLRKPVFSGK